MFIPIKPRKLYWFRLFRLNLEIRFKPFEYTIWWGTRCEWVDTDCMDKDLRDKLSKLKHIDND